MDRPPVVRPAVVAGAGTGASLAAAALCILALGTATIGFVQWPATDVSEPEGRAVLRLPEPPRQPARLSAEPVLREGIVSRPRVAARRKPRRRTERPTRVQPRRSGLAAPVASATPTPAPSPSPAPSPAPTPTLLRGHIEAAASSVRETGRGTPVELVTETAAATVEQAARLLP
jgi:hypothetical protein